MASTWRQMLLIVLVASVVLFTNLGGPRLWDRDEPRNAGCTVEMLERGDYVTPVFDGELRTHKPILLYWLMMISYGVFGVSEFAARFWSAALGVGTACLTYLMGRRLFSPAVGMYAAVIVVTTLMFDVAARAATPDSVLIFWSAAAIAVFVWGTYPAVKQGEQSGGPQRLFPAWPKAILMYACMGMAVLAKGPIGLVLPTAVVGMFLLLFTLPPRSEVRSLGGFRSASHRLMSLLRPIAPQHFLRTCWRMRPLTAVAVSMAVALPWYVAVAIRTDGEWVRGFLLDHNLGRAAQSLEGHSGAWFYYPVALLIGFFPWSVFAVPTVLNVGRRLRSRDPQSAGYLLAACWVGVYLVLFSLARTKLPSYITPCYPGVALLVGSFLDAWIRGRTVSAAYWPRLALVCLGMVGVGIMIAVPVATTQVLSGEEWLGLLGVIPLVTAVACDVLTRRHATRLAVTTFALGAVLLTTSLFAVGAVRVDRHQTFHTLVSAMRARSERPQIGTLGVLEPSWVFYCGRPLDHLFAPELLRGVPSGTAMVGQIPEHDWQPKPQWNVWKYLEGGGDRFVITTAGQLQQLGPLPPHVSEVARTSYFLQNEELVLLGTVASATAWRKKPLVLGDPPAAQKR